MLFALSSDSINCSKLSNAMSLSERGIEESRIEFMDSFIRSASDGPPNMAFKTDGSMGRDCCGCSLVSVVGSVGLLFSIDHFRRLDRLGSCVMLLEDF